MDALDGESDLSDLSDAPSLSRSPVAGPSASPARLNKKTPRKASAAYKRDGGTAAASLDAPASASPERVRRRSSRVSLEGERQAPTSVRKAINRTTNQVSSAKTVTYGSDKVARPSRTNSLRDSVKGDAADEADTSPGAVDPTSSTGDRNRRGAMRSQTKTDHMEDDQAQKPSKEASRSSARRPSRVSSNKEKRGQVEQGEALEEQGRLSPPPTPGPPATPGPPSEPPSRSSLAEPLLGAPAEAQSSATSQRKIKLKTGRTNGLASATGESSTLVNGAPDDAGSPSDGQAAPTEEETPRNARGRRSNAGKNFSLDKQRAADSAAARLSAGTSGGTKRPLAGGVLEGSAMKKSRLKAREEERTTKEDDENGAAVPKEGERGKGKFTIKLKRHNGSSKGTEAGHETDRAKSASASVSASPLSDLSDVAIAAAEQTHEHDEEEDEGPTLSKRRSRANLSSGRPDRHSAFVSADDHDAKAVSAHKSSRSKLGAKKRKEAKVVESDSEDDAYEQEEGEEEDVEMGVEAQQSDDDAYEEEGDVSTKRKKASREDVGRGSASRPKTDKTSYGTGQNRKTRQASLYSDEEIADKPMRKKGAWQTLKQKKSVASLDGPVSSGVSTPVSHAHAGAVSKVSGVTSGGIPLPRKAGGSLAQSRNPPVPVVRDASAGQHSIPPVNKKAVQSTAPRKSGGMAAFSNIFGSTSTPSAGTPSKSNPSGPSKDSPAAQSLRKDGAGAHVGTTGQKRQGRPELAQGNVVNTTSLPKPLGFGSNASLSGPGGASGLRGNSMSRGRNQAGAGWGANGEHLT